MIKFRFLTFTPNLLNEKMYESYLLNLTNDIKSLNKQSKNPSWTGLMVSLHFLSTESSFPESVCLKGCCHKQAADCRPRCLNGPHTAQQFVPPWVWQALCLRQEQTVMTRRRGIIAPGKLPVLFNSKPFWTKVGSEFEALTNFSWKLSSQTCSPGRPLMRLWLHVPDLTLGSSWEDAVMPLSKCF